MIATYHFGPTSWTAAARTTGRIQMIDVVWYSEAPNVLLDFEDGSALYVYPQHRITDRGVDIYRATLYPDVDGTVRNVIWNGGAPGGPVGQVTIAWRAT